MEAKINAFMDLVKQRNHHEPEFLQAVQEVAETVIPYTLQWLRANDLDKNGNIEIFENQKLDNWFNIEYNGSKFIKK